ncbi:MAG: rhomboid family intramembrane serine protease [Bacteroidaceae bacterium]|nr:rhomboid family intramembrane serine protease [Bacteroidaceae bacterium]
MKQTSVVNTLLIANILVFLFSLVIKLEGLFGLHYFMSRSFNIFQLVTYMFMHGGFMHLFFNMFALWMFGRLLEQVWGWKRFLIYYFVCGIGAGLTQEIGQMMGVIHPLATTVGASGAVYGILLAFGMTFPNEKMFIIPFPFPIKAKYFVMIYVAIELYEGFGANDGIAHWAHLGGMLFGAMLFLYWKHLTHRVQGVKKMKVTYNTADNYDRSSKPASSASHRVETPSQEHADEIDRILDKIRKSGYTGLTDAEKRTLFDASQKNGRQ